MAFFILQTSEPGQNWQSFALTKCLYPLGCVFYYYPNRGDLIVVVLRRQAGCENVEVISDEEETGAEGARHTSWRSEILQVKVVE